MRKFLSDFIARTKRLGFTLPEIVTALTIGGAVSILVLNTAFKEITTQTMNTERMLANNEIAVAAADLQAEDALSGNKTQEEFNKKFAKVLSFTEIPSDEVSKRFASSYTDSDGNKFSADNYKNKVVTSNGVSFAYTYDTSCNVNYQFSQSGAAKSGNNYGYMVKNEALKCINGFIDINGAKGPNEYGKDVMFLSKFEKDCYDKNGNISNFIPNAYGNCPDDKDKNEEGTLTPAASVCTLTELNCKANGSLKTLDRTSCECVCKISCPQGQTLNKETCTCSCDTDAIENKICKRNDAENPYSDCSASKQACTCMPKNPNAPDICKKNGGEWNSATCSCSCTSGRKNSIKKEFNNLAIPDEDNFCVPKCIYKDKNDAFKAQVRQNALDNGLDDAKVVEITNISTVENKCFVCATNTTNNMEYTKNDVAEKGGFCSSGCNDTLKNSNAYDRNYFAFIDYDKNDIPNSCKWVCKTGENEGIKKYVKELNNNSSYTTPKILNAGDGSTNLENFKLAQTHYFRAAVLGKAATENEGSYTNSASNWVTINGKQYWASRMHRCETGYRGCVQVFNAFKDNNSVFAGFLKFAASSSTAPEYAYGWSSSTNADTYKIHYTANTNNCTVETTGFDFGTSPTSQIPYHGAGIGTEFLAEMVTFVFEPIKNYANNKLVIPNPNNNIKAPDAFKSQGSYSKYSDNSWKEMPIGVSISYKTQYDPLALNISSTPNSDPSVMTPATVSFPIEYANGRYNNVSVHWPNENTYRFVVNENFKNNSWARHIGNMFSDQMSSDGHQYATGFDQLQAQYDTNNDNIISRDEMSKLYLYYHRGNDWAWGTMDRKFIPLTEFVLDLNLYKTAVRDESGSGIQNDNIIYDIQGSYRKLINASYSKPTCSNGNNCMSYIGYKRIGLDTELVNFLKIEEGNKYVAELWQDMKNNNIYYYYLREKGGEAKDYPSDKNGWQKIVKTDIVETKGAQLPQNTTIVADNNIPDIVKEKVVNEEGSITTVYKDEDNVYYVVKETVIEDEQESAEDNTQDDNNPSNNEEPNNESNNEPNENGNEDENTSNDSLAPTTGNTNSVNARNRGRGKQINDSEPQTPAREIRREITKYELNKYSKAPNVEIHHKYFKNNNVWYEVIVAKITDIIFKYSR